MSKQKDPNGTPQMAPTGSSSLMAANEPSEAAREPRRAPVRLPDPELQAMGRIARVLAGLSEPQASRIVAWLSDRYLRPDGVVETVVQG